MEDAFADWRLLMAGIQLWLSGGNPYGQYPHPVAEGVIVHVGAYAYPPPTLILFTPLALLPWPISSMLMLMFSIVPFDRWCRKTTQRSALPWVLAWLPFAQGIWVGQTTLLVLAALIWAEQANQERRFTWAGLLLALALLKPQVGILPIAWLLVAALWKRQWRLPLSFALFSALFWGSMLLISGPQIYIQWYTALTGYQDFLPNRPLIFPPLGPLVGAVALYVWYRRGRGDWFGVALLLNTLLYPLSVIYAISALAVVIIRWNPRWAWYPIILSWFLARYVMVPLISPDHVAGNVQAIVIASLLAIVLPQIPLPWLRSRPPMLQ